MQITIDDRERNSALFEWLDILAAGQWKRRRLPVGDILIASEEPVLIERKTMDDFAVSLVQGRLFLQARRMLSFYGRRFLIIEGEAIESKIDPRALRGAEIAMVLKFALPVLRTADPRETIETSCYLARQLGRPYAAVRYGGYRAKSLKGRRSQLLQQLPGIGPARARSLLEHFGSIRAIINASPEELTAVKHVAAKTAKDIDDILSEPPARFNSRKAA